MTKQEELRKYANEVQKYTDELQKYVEELRKFVDGLDKQQQLGHGDLVYLGDHTEEKDKRIVIDTASIGDRDERYVFLDKDGRACNNVKDLSYTFAKYTKIRNAFKDK